MEDINYKELDRQAILDYLSNKKNTLVSDIIEHSGASKLRVYPILFELEQEHKLVVTEVERMGAAKAVMLL